MHYNSRDNKNHLEKKKPMKWAQEAKRAQVAWAPSQTVQPMLVWALEFRCRPSSSPDAQFDLKGLYKDPPPPSAIAIRGGRETRNTETEAVLVKIGGGNAIRVAPGCFSILSDINTIITAMKRE
jgi:hypothetical protein